MIQLYSVPESLYSAKLRILLRKKSIPFETIMPPGGYGSPEYKRIIPAGTVPAIVHDGFALADSEAIAEYLNDRFPAPPMLPGDIHARAKARERSRFHDTRLEPEVRSVFGQIAPSGRLDALVRAKGQIIETRLNQLAGLVETASDISIGDIGFPISFLWIDLFAPVLGWKIHWPEAVRRYRARLEADQHVREELADYSVAARAWIQSKEGQ